MLAVRPRRIAIEQCLGRRPDIWLDDADMLPWVDAIAVRNVTAIEDAAQQMSDGACTERLAADYATIAHEAALRTHTARGEVIDETADRFQHLMAFEDQSLGGSLVLADDQFALDNVVAERNGAPIHMPFNLLAAILSRIRSPVTSR